MAKWGFDLAFHPALPTYTAILAANGAAFVCRYLSWLPNSKCIDRAEYDGLVAAGVDVVLNWEYDGHAEILAGYYSGQKAAGEAVRQARLLGHPPGAAIYFSCDWHITDPGQARAFFQGARSAIGEYRVGIYGDYAVVDALLADGTCDYGWQTYGWSAGRLSGRAHLYQYQNGVNVSGMWVDRDRSLRIDFGSRACALATGSSPAPAQAPDPPASQVIGDLDTMQIKRMAKTISLSGAGDGWDMFPVDSSKLLGNPIVEGPWKSADSPNPNPAVGAAEPGEICVSVTGGPPNGHVGVIVVYAD